MISLYDHNVIPLLLRLFVFASLSTMNFSITFIFFMCPHIELGIERVYGLKVVSLDKDSGGCPADQT